MSFPIHSDPTSTSLVPVPEPSHAFDRLSASDDLLPPRNNRIGSVHFKMLRRVLFLLLLLLLMIN